MRFVYALLVPLLLFVSSAMAQDGIYGNFIVGKRFVDLANLQDSLNANGYNVTFNKDHWTFGGEGHVIVAKHLALGAKGIAFFDEKTVINDTVKTWVKVSGGLTVVTAGYALTAGPLRLIPQVGIGMAPFLFQMKQSLPNGANSSFGDIVRANDDGMVALTKGGWIIDPALNIDWYMKFLKLVGIIPGLTIGPMLHADIGYSYNLGGNSHWLRDIDGLNKVYTPDMKFNGFYFNVGIGLGLTTSKVEKDDD